MPILFLQIGLTFLALSLPYFVASPLWGYACDHMIESEYVQALGNFLTVIGFCLVGPGDTLAVMFLCRCLLDVYSIVCS